jgi:hypothetical protein
MVAKSREETMSLDNVILNRSKKVDSALETLSANRKYRQEKRTHGIERVNLYVEDAEGEWLENWIDTEQSSTDTQ